MWMRPLLRAVKETRNFRQFLPIRTTSCAVTSTSVHSQLKTVFEFSPLPVYVLACRLSTLAVRGTFSNTLHVHTVPFSSHMMSGIKSHQ